MHRCFREHLIEVGVPHHFFRDGGVESALETQLSMCGFALPSEETLTKKFN